jgi:hypothetical protein
VLNLGKINNSIFAIMESKGLGDTIEKITTATGIKKVVDRIAKATGKDCGCGERKNKLNKALPYKK